MLKTYVRLFPNESLDVYVDSAIAEPTARWLMRHCEVINYHEEVRQEKIQRAKDKWNSIPEIRKSPRDYKRYQEYLASISKPFDITELWSIDWVSTEYPEIRYATIHCVPNEEVVRRIEEKYSIHRVDGYSLTINSQIEENIRAEEEAFVIF